MTEQLVIIMKIERIGENKIKITVSIEDLNERNIALEALNYNSREAQELFWDMMKKAEMEFGFSTSDAQLCIEAVPDALEGFVITITKIEDEVDEAFESIQKYIRNKYRKSDLKSKKRLKKVSSPLLIYSFASADDLKSLCQRIFSAYTAESTLYKYANVYYLVLSKTGWNDAYAIDSLLQEYGKKVHYPSFYEGLLEEYGKKIVDQNALNIILNYY